MGRASPGDERGSMAGGLCPSTHPMLAVPAGSLPGAGLQEGSPRTAKVVVGASSPEPAPDACWVEDPIALWTPESLGAGSTFPGCKRAVWRGGWGLLEGGNMPCTHSCSELQHWR